MSELTPPAPYTFVVHTAQCVAELRGIPLNKLHAATTDNFFELFNGAKALFC